MVTVAFRSSAGGKGARIEAGRKTGSGEVAERLKALVC